MECETFQDHLSPELESHFNVMIERNIRVAERSHFEKEFTSLQMNGRVHPNYRTNYLCFNLATEFHHRNRELCDAKIENVAAKKSGHCWTYYDTFDLFTYSTPIPIQVNSKIKNYLVAYCETYDLAMTNIENDKLFTAQESEKCVDERYGWVMLNNLNFQTYEI